MKPNLKVGELVLIVETTPCHEWPLARIVETFPDAGGLVRKLRLINARGRKFERHVTGVVSLEVTNNNDNNIDNSESES